MDEIREVVGSLIKDLDKQRKKIDLEKVQAVWEAVAGPKAAAHTKIVYLTKEKIRVNVNSSAWLYELHLKKERLEKEILKKLKIPELELRLGDIR